MCSLVKKKSIPNWHLYITQMETKWTKWYVMTSHVIAHRSTELLFGTHTFNFNCFFDDFNSVFTQIRCLSRLLMNQHMHCYQLKKTLKEINIDDSIIFVTYPGRILWIVFSHVNVLLAHLVLTFCIRKAPQWVLLQIVKTQMKCRIMRHFIRVYTVC